MFFGNKIEKGFGQERAEGSKKEQNNDTETVENYIESLFEGSRYRRTSQGNVDVLYNPESGQRYEIGRIEASDLEKEESQELLKEIHGLLEEYHLQTGITESFEELAEWLKDEECDLGIFYIKDEKGEIVAANCTEFLPLIDQEGNETSEGILIGWYAATKEAVRLEQLTREIFPNSFQFGLDAARKNRINLTAFVIEAADRRLSLLIGGQDQESRGKEKVRPFYYDEEGNLCEVPYRSPDTGEFSHLIVLMFDSRDELSADELLEIIRTIFHDYYDNEEEVEKHRNDWEPIIEDISNKLQGKEIHMLGHWDVRERAKELKSQGKELVEYESPWEGERKEIRQRE